MVIYTVLYIKDGSWCYYGYYLTWLIVINGYLMVIIYGLLYIIYSYYMLKYVTQIIWFLMAMDNYMVMILHDYYMIMDRYNHKYSWY